MWLLMLTTGLRRGEIAGLSVVVVEPKTAKGRRSVALDDVTVPALRSSRKTQRHERPKPGTAWQDWASSSCGTTVPRITPSGSS